LITHMFVKFGKVGNDLNVIFGQLHVGDPSWCGPNPETTLKWSWIAYILCPNRDLFDFLTNLPKLLQKSLDPRSIPYTLFTDPDPALFVSDFWDANKNIFPNMFCLFTFFRCIYISLSFRLFEWKFKNKFMVAFLSL
jgi:hypothetical protein